MSMHIRLTAIALIAGLAACSSFDPTDGPPRSGRVPDTRDAVPRDEPLSKSGNPPFYEVYGKRYHVMTSRSGYIERGVASWYGSKFHGKSTANGERYDMYAMTAAHKRLPLPAYVEVTNLRNGKSVVVRVNDRGPFVDNRLIDVSYAAAKRLDMINDGTTMVEVRTLDRRKGSAATRKPAAESLYLQVGAFGERVNAEKMQRYLTTNGVKNVLIRDDRVNGRTYYRVRVGPVPTVEEFDRLVEQARSLDIHDTHLALD